MHRDNCRRPDNPEASNHGSSGSRREPAPNCSCNNDRQEGSCNRERRGAGPSASGPSPGGQGHGGTVNSSNNNSRCDYDARTTITARCRARELENDNDTDGFPAYSRHLRGFLLPKKFKPLGISKYDGKQDPKQWLRYYDLAIENAGVTTTPNASTSPSAWSKCH